MKPKIKFAVTAILTCILVALFATFCLASEGNSLINVRINAQPNKGFFYPYYLHIPPNLRSPKALTRKHTILVIPNNTGEVNDDLKFHESNVKSRLFKVGIVFSKLETVVLMPVFPRPKKDWRIYTHALDRDSLLTLDKTYKRLDLQLIAMIKHAKSQLKKEKIKAEQKVLMYGFSASGMFVNRFSFLHPEIVKAVAVGSPGGWAIAPIGNYKKNKLRYPIGVNDFKLISGKTFRKSVLQRIPMFFFLGDKDTNDSVTYRDSYDAIDEKLIIKHFGKTPVERWEKSKKLYIENGLNAKFKLYPKVGHKVSWEMLKDIITFLSKHKKLKTALNQKHN